jgi:hypothetical protein
VTYALVGARSDYCKIIIVSKGACRGCQLNLTSMLKSIFGESVGQVSIIIISTKEYLEVCKYL